MNKGNKNYYKFGVFLCLTLPNSMLNNIIIYFMEGRHSSYDLWNTFRGHKICWRIDTFVVVGQSVYMQFFGHQLYDVANKPHFVGGQAFATRARTSSHLYFSPSKTLWILHMSTKNQETSLHFRPVCLANSFFVSTNIFSRITYVSVWQQIKKINTNVKYARREVGSCSIFGLPVIQK